MTERIEIKSLTTGIVLLFILYGIFSQYLFASIVAGIVLAAIIDSLWIPYQPPVLVYLFAYQWLQIFGAIVLADFMGRPIDMLYMSKGTPFLIVVTLLQLGMMAYFTSKVLDLKETPRRTYLENAALQLDTRKVLIGYVICTIAFPVLIGSTVTIPSLNQLLISFAVIKKIFLIMLLFIVLLTKTKYRTTIYLILFVEFILSFTSYFSSFKEIFIFILIVYFTVIPTIKAKVIVRIAPLVGVLVVLLVFWSSVKVGYRDFLNRGSRMQEVTVDKFDALNYIADRAASYNSDSLKEGTQILLYRIQYMHQYSNVYTRVPSIIPYTNGSNIISALTFVGIPRSFVGNKAILDPSTKASYYTGRTFATAQQGTSISMGYFCDMYIDFGLWLMIVPLLILTYVVAKGANYILSSGKYNLIFTYSLFIGVFLSLGTFESDIIFYLGTLRNYAVVLILGNLLIFPWIAKAIKA